MGVNPDTNKIEELHQVLQDPDDGSEGTCFGLVRADGTPVPKHWTILKQGELVDIKGYTFRIEYIGETSVLLEPVKPVDTIKSVDAQ